MLIPVIGQQVRRAVRVLLARQVVQVLRVRVAAPQAHKVRAVQARRVQVQALQVVQNLQVQVL